MFMEIVLKKFRRIIFILIMGTLLCYALPSVSAAEVSEEDTTTEELECQYNAIDEEKLQSEEVMNALAEYLYIDEENKVQVDDCYKTTNDSEYVEELTKLASFLDEINSMVDKNEVFIDEDGYYRIAEVSDDYVLQDAVNDFTVRHTACRIKIFWKTFTIWVPVGYTIKLNTLSSLFFGGLSLLFNAKTVGAAQKAILANGSTIKSLLISGGKALGLSTFANDTEKFIVNMLYAFSLANASIDALTLVSSGGLVTIVKKVLTFLLATYVWTQIGTHLLLGAVEILVLDSYNRQQLLTIVQSLVTPSIVVDYFIGGKAISNITNALRNIRGGMYVNTNLLLYHQSHGKQ